MSDYKQAWFVVPNRIMQLEGLTLAYLKIFETIFQFWNNDKPCYLSNSMIMERTGIQSVRTIQEALTFFEGHKEIKRQEVEGRRFLTQPAKSVELKIAKLSTPPALECAPPPQRNAPPPRSKLRPNTNKINTNKLNKRKGASFSENQKPKAPPAGHGTATAVNPSSSYVNRDTRSDEARHAERGDVKTAEQYLSNMKGIRLKRYHSIAADSR